ncbi:MAG TPA: DUF6252 family protein [Flavobacterium sp.]|jgi:hypothetical protein
MKKFASLILVIIAAATFSCSDDDNDNNDNDDLYVRFTQNNIDYDMDDPLTAGSFNMAINGDTGSGNDLRRMVLFIPFNPTEGTHEVENDLFDETAYGARYTIGEDVVAYATDGTITITDVNDEFVTGTFSFVMTDSETDATYTISEGSFRAYNISDE